MYVNKQISELTNNELSQAMRELNLNVGPITSSTRKIYENRLKSHLGKKGKPEDDKNQIETQSAADATDNAPQPVVNGIVNGINNDTCNTSDLRCNQPTETDLDANNDSPFFGVWIPFSPTRIVDKSKPNVFRSREEALRKMKQYRGSRFKSFKCFVDAEKFSHELPTVLNVDEICNLINSNASITEPPAKVSVKTPSFQELMKFRKAIEDDNLLFVKECLSNPKYLISSSDIPVILQEGTRLNSIHVAVKCNKVNICQHIMRTIQSNQFLVLIYPDSPAESLSFRKEHFVNLYLNTPEKMLCETPLHLACKFGFPKIVEFLLQFPEVNVEAKNKDGKTSRQLICTRINAQSDTKRMIFEEIDSLFEEKAFIPLYRDPDSFSTVGKPIMTLSKERLSMSEQNVKAYAGPMSPTQATSFYHMWKKSPRNGIYREIARADFEKGMERIGRTLASKEQIPFFEYWQFLSSYANLSLSDGLSQFENYLKNSHGSRKKKNREKTKSRKSFSASSEHSKSRLTVSADDVKRKLTFELGEEINHSSTEAKEPVYQERSCANTSLEENLVKSGDTKTNLILDMDVRTECYCSCGQLIEYCEKCSVDLDLESLSVAFKTCSPSSSFSKQDSDSCGNEATTHDNSNTLHDLEEDDDMVDIAFIDGDVPSKHDLDVLRAIVDVDLQPYPYILRWKELVESYPVHLRTSWPSPGSPRYKLSNRNVIWTD